MLNFLAPVSKNSKISKYYSLLCNSYTLFTYFVDEVVSNLVRLCIGIGKMVGGCAMTS